VAIIVVFMVETCLLLKEQAFFELSGLAGHLKNDLHIVMAQAVINLHKGPVIAIIYHQL
jgi:hypothetical protein